MCRQNGAHSLVKEATVLESLHLLSLVSLQIMSTSTSLSLFLLFPLIYFYFPFPFLQIINTFLLDIIKEIFKNHCHFRVKLKPFLPSAIYIERFALSLSLLCKLIVFTKVKENSRIPCHSLRFVLECPHCPTPLILFILFLKSV